MYVQKHFEESRVDVLHDLIIAHPFSTLVTMSSIGINANHIPLHLIQEAGQYGTLQGHVARANPAYRAPLRYAPFSFALGVIGMVASA